METTDFIKCITADLSHDDRSATAPTEFYIRYCEMEDFEIDIDLRMASSDFPFAEIFIGKEKFGCQQNVNDEPTLNMINTGMPFCNAIKLEMPSDDYEMSDSEKITSWVNKPVNTWEEEEVSLWASYVSTKYNFSIFGNIVVKFCQCKGDDLCKMPYEKFVDMISDKNIAEKYYSELQTVIKNNDRKLTNVNEVLTTFERVKLDNESNTFDNMMDTNFADTDNNDSDWKGDSGVEDCDELASDAELSYTSDDQFENDNKTRSSLDGSNMLSMLDGIFTDKKSSSNVNSSSNVTPQPQKKRPGRPPGSKKPPKEKKIGKLWENLKNWLYDPEYNPSVICWDNYQSGIFRFTDSAKAAKLWGTIKGNPDMTFEKMTRAMRYHYKNNVLVSVEKKLLYQFGEKAYGWRRANPIL